MKTAISIPDDTFDAAEHFASNAGISRSELYTKAVIEYVDKHRHIDITKTLNKIYTKTDSSLNPEFHSMQLNSLQKKQW